MDDDDISPEQAVQLPLVVRNRWFKEQTDAYDRKRREEDERQTFNAYHREQVRNVRERMGLGEQTARRSNGAAAEDENVVLPQISVASFAARPPPDRAWHVPDLIPAGQVTMFGGDGKVGKSKLAMQLCVATAAELDWLGMKPAVGPVLYVGAEDDIPEFHRRFQEIADSYGVKLDELKHALILIPLADRDAVLAATAKPGRIATTGVWRGLEAMVVQHKPCLVVFDSLADVYAGNEINRSEARQFVSLLRGLSIQNSLTAVLLSHPSLAGIQSGSGTSGSTAWSNSVRSRLALERLKDGAKEIEPDRRVLKIMRSNYGPADKQIRLRWADGVWELDGSDAEGGFDNAAADAKVERVFCNILADMNGQDRFVSPNKSSAYAPAVFADHPSSEGIDSKAFARAMERMLTARRLLSEDRMDLPPSKRTKRILFAPRKEET